MPRRREVLIVSDGAVRPGFLLALTFSDGVRKLVNVFPLLRGPIFAPLRDPAYFALGRYDPIGGTVAWPNGADFAPVVLWELPDQSARATDRA